MGKFKVRLSARVDALAGSVAAHRRDINQLNRRIDNLVELITEIDKKLDTPTGNGNNRDNSDICDNVLIDYDNDCAP